MQDILKFNILSMYNVLVYPYSYTCSITPLKYFFTLYGIYREVNTKTSRQNILLPECYLSRMASTLIKIPL